MKRFLFALVLLAAIFIVIPGSPLGSASAPAAKATAIASITAAAIADSPWTPAGLETADVTGVVSAGGGILFAVTPGIKYKPILYRSNNWGASWAPVGELPFWEYAAGTLAISPTDPRILFATSRGEPWGAVRSTDGGTTWTRIHLADNAVAFHPSNPALVYGTGSNGYSATFERSFDGGLNWTGIVLPAAGHMGFRISISPVDPSVIYLATRNTGNSFNCRIFRSQNGGDVWTDVTGSIGASTAIHDVAADGTAAGRVYAATIKGVFRSADLGATWILSPAFRSCWAVASDPSRSGIVHAACIGSAYRSADGGASWTRTGTVRGTPRMLTVEGTRVYMTGTAGIYVLPGDSGPWTASNHGLRFRGGADVAISRSSPNVVFASVAEDGLYRSNDAGISWNRLPDQGWLRSGGGLLGIDPRSSEILYAASQLDTQAWTRTLYRSRDGGRTWAAILRANFLTFAQSPSEPNRLAAGGFLLTLRDRGIVWLSSNGGGTWTRRVSPGPIEGVSALAFGPGPIVYAGAGTTDDHGLSPTGSLSRSLDFGASWQIMQQDYVEALSASPAKPQRLYEISTGDTYELWKVLKRSDDGGEGWLTLPFLDTGGTGRELERFFVHSGALDEILASGDDHKPIYLTEGDAAWTPIVLGLAGSPVSVAAWNPDSGLAFAVGEGRVYRNTGLRASH